MRRECVGRNDERMRCCCRKRSIMIVVIAQLSDRHRCATRASPTRAAPGNAGAQRVVLLEKEFTLAPYHHGP
jgi:hypothetical protein